MSATRLPVVALGHGGGPSFFLDPPRFPLMNSASAARRALENLMPAANIKALLVVSAHWETAQPKLISRTSPKLLYDYSGFPSEMYAPHLTYDCVGDDGIAQRVMQLTGATLDDDRGYDHGVFVPLLLAVPDASIPVLQLSIGSDLDVSSSFELGRKLAPLRDEGVLIIGSGFLTHRMGGSPNPEATQEWISDARHALLSGDSAHARKKKLEQLTQGKSFRFAHPREEHWIPYVVAAGAAGSDEGSVVFEETEGNWCIDIVSFE